MTDSVETPAPTPTLESRVAALEEQQQKAPAVDAKTHCWDPILDHGGQVPIYLPLTPDGEPVRFIAVTQAEGLVTRFRCCHCGKRAERRWESKRVDAKGKHANGVHGHHHEVFDLVSADPLPVGPCTGRSQA